MATAVPNAETQTDTFSREEIHQRKVALLRAQLLHVKNPGTQFRLSQKISVPLSTIERLFFGSAEYACGIDDDVVDRVAEALSSTSMPAEAHSALMQQFAFLNQACQPSADEMTILVAAASSEPMTKEDIAADQGVEEAKASAPEQSLVDFCGQSLAWPAVMGAAKDHGVNPTLINPNLVYRRTRRIPRVIESA